MKSDRRRNKKPRTAAAIPTKRPAEHQRGLARPELLVTAGIAAVALLFLSIFTLSEPYHLDTTAYFDALADLATGHVRCGYGTRCMVSYFLIPFAVAGSHAVKAGLVFAAVASFVFSWLFVRRMFSRNTAYLSSLLLLTIPAGLMTITHLKEDFVGLMFIAVSLFLATLPRSGWRLASALGLGLGLLSKEWCILYVPFYGSIQAYCLFIRSSDVTAELRRPRNWIVLAATITIPFVVAVAVKHDYFKGLASLGDSPYLGQFKGPFSDLLPTGFGLFERGIGFAPLFWLQLLAVALLYLEKDWRKRVLYGAFATNAVLVALFSMNNTVVTYRNFVIVAFLTFPPAIRSLEILVRKQWLLYAAGGILIVGTIAKTYPCVDFHARYNTQKGFLIALKDKLQANPVLLTMDYAGLIKYYLGVRTKQHIPDPDDVQSKLFGDGIEADEGKSYYLFPDAISYDSKGRLRALLQQEFRFDAIQKEWFEDYHTMDYGYSPSELGSVLERQTGCRANSTKDGTTSIGEVNMDMYRYDLDCGDRGHKSSEYPGYKGKVFPSLLQAQVFRLLSAPTR